MGGATKAQDDAEDQDKEVLEREGEIYPPNTNEPE